jgi:hypothetical protein
MVHLIQPAGFADVDAFGQAETNEILPAHEPGERAYRFQMLLNELPPRLRERWHRFLGYEIEQLKKKQKGARRKVDGPIAAYDKEIARRGPLDKKEHRALIKELASAAGITPDHLQREMKKRKQ